MGSFDPGFTATSPNTPGSIEVTISGETLGENGLPFTPVNMGDPQFVDGWNMKFDKYIVVIGNVRLSPNALQYNPGALSAQVNPPIAVRKGPFVIDVHRLATSAPGDFVGADGQEPAGGLFAWNADDSGNAFDTNTLFAFSYDTEPAQYPATQVNLTPDELAIYDKMVKHGWNKYIEAHATYVGYGAPAANGPAAGTMPYPDATVQTRFSKLPTTVHFVFGWADNTSYVNCINPFNGDMTEDNPMNRGVRPNSNGAAVAQITFHTDHVFWDKLKQEGTPLRFDYIAAWAPQDTSATPIDLGSLALMPLAATFNDCTPLPDRAPYQNVPGGYMSDQGNPNQVVLNTNGVTGIKGIADFMAFSAQSQGHLNANGLCYVVGQNASDPFYQPAVTPASGMAMTPTCSGVDAGTPTDAGL